MTLAKPPGKPLASPRAVVLTPAAHLRQEPGGIAPRPALPAPRPSAVLRAAAFPRPGAPAALPAPAAHRPLLPLPRFRAVARLPADLAHERARGAFAGPFPGRIPNSPRMIAPFRTTDC